MDKRDKIDYYLDRIAELKSFIHDMAASMQSMTDLAADHLRKTAADPSFDPEQDVNIQKARSFIQRARNT